MKTKTNPVNVAQTKKATRINIENELFGLNRMVKFCQSDEGKVFLQPFIDSLTTKYGYTVNLSFISVKNVSDAMTEKQRYIHKKNKETGKFESTGELRKVFRVSLILNYLQKLAIANKVTQAKNPLQTILSKVVNLSANERAELKKAI